VSAVSNSNRRWYSVARRWSPSRKAAAAALRFDEEKTVRRWQEDYTNFARTGLNCLTNACDFARAPVKAIVFESRAYD
jgi:hypothetical protein